MTRASAIVDTGVSSGRGRRRRAIIGMINARLFAVICSDRTVGAAVITPSANTEAMSLRLTEAALRLRPALVPRWSATVQDGTNGVTTCKIRNHITLLPLSTDTPGLIRWERPGLPAAKQALFGTPTTTSPMPAGSRPGPHPSPRLRRLGVCQSFGGSVLAVPNEIAGAPSDYPTLPYPLGHSGTRTESS
jgi:hypothetical protein